MKKFVFIIGIIALTTTACSQPDARRPVSSKSGSFMRSSIERNKSLLDYEETLIDSIIASDSINTYIVSQNGYQYFYNTENAEDTISPEEGDVVKITYNVRTLTEDTIYTNDDIGIVEFRIDKEALFPGLRTAVKLMNTGETATFYFPSSMGYGYHGDEKRIGTNEPLISTISLLEIKKENNANSN
ncbi:gliding motility-associated peptidyl-prolyl isomerase GldI [Robertkochia solimangrovi]|uniref:gliding motility-associated peptidyl-prolyl isomerase GldI n=1 Tax=Robertkochia solimangrovi TaxID=2213046 RepID=UPI00117EE18F|nr:gliding motility-associated peptidyl-prolyl isomerase GldI [Robertkochia solimangrovi]TRZ43598.1 gliding motility-associated peptidyl-prolyl isomerase GldI [Robertkochia solimangrovi]